ncbi:hypothetical protein JZ751_017356 [Albula glossodonta]|uniref:C3H1-type domain-containing protein n=1 Tax=Albula glossodonta TaxID=121402 RepID=A0A8T2PKP1_9TELE|nr:hypothetical protein JZ751_017356 [Albula glossodonta]
MTNHGDDCYFYYYSTCTKGDSCPFRHCEAAMGSEVVCNLWQENRCFRKICKFRHMEIKKKRNEIPCYWENQPAGCQKPHCAFHHEKPRIIDGVFVPPSKGPIPRKDVEEEPAPLVNPSSPAPGPVANPANPQLRGVIKVETLENVPSPTHPPVVINPADDEDEDEDDQFSEEGEESSSRTVSPRKLISTAIKGQSNNNLSQGIGIADSPDPHSNGTNVEKENIRSFVRPQLIVEKEDAPFQNEEPVKRNVTDRLGKRKVDLTGESLFSLKKDLPVAKELPLKRRLAERLGRKVDSTEDSVAPPPQKVVKPVRCRLGLPGEPAPSESESVREAPPPGEIRIKTLEEIRKEKVAKTPGQGKASGAAIKVPSPIKKSSKPAGGIHVKTFSEILHAKKKQEEMQKAAVEEQAQEDGSSGKGKAPSQGQGVEKVPAAQHGEVRVKTLEEIRREKAARMQAMGPEAKTEDISSPVSGAGSVAPKRRILRIKKTTAAEADKAGNTKTSEVKEKSAEPVATENGSANGKRNLPSTSVKVKTFEEIMREKRLRKQLGEQASASLQKPEDPTTPSHPKQQVPTPQGVRPLTNLRQRASTAPQPSALPFQPKTTTTADHHRISLKQKEPESAPAAVSNITPSTAAQYTSAGSPTSSVSNTNSSNRKQSLPSPELPAAPHADETASPVLPQEEVQDERTQGPTPKTSPVQLAETKVRPKLNVKPSVVKAATQVKLGQKRKAQESHRSAVAAVKPLNSAPDVEEGQSQDLPSRSHSVMVPETSTATTSLEMDVQACPLGPKLSIPKSSEAEVLATPGTEQRLGTPEPLSTPAKEPCATPQSSPAVVKTPVQPKPRRQSLVAPRAQGSSATMDDLDELMNEFADDPLDGEMELDPAKDEDDLLLELSEMIGS